MSDPIAPYEWDEVKRAANIADHRIDFTAIYDFEWDTAVFAIDDREDYGELREIATGFVGNALHVIIYTEHGEMIRVISVRRAENRDKRIYVETKRREIG
jgi:uncharacterized DUF497 family protein